jgi:hypothetical protein
MKSDTLNMERDILPQFGRAFVAVEDNIKQMNKFFALSGRAHQA